MTAVKRVIVIVPTVADFLEIESTLASEQVQVMPAASLLEAVLAHTYHAMETISEREHGPVLLYDTDSPDSWRQVVRQFLRINPNARVVVLSRLADEQMWMDVLGTGGHDLLAKPATAADIHAAVYSAIDRASRAGMCVAA